MTNNTDKKDAVYKIIKLLRKNVIKILVVLREQEKIRWKELQEETKMSTATFNRALSALQEMHFIQKKDQYYEITWAGRLVVDGLMLLGLRTAELPGWKEEIPESEKLEDVIAEKVLAKDIAILVLLIIFMSLRFRGRLNLDELQKELDNEKSVIKEIIDEYEKEGYLERKDGVLTATDKFEELAAEELLSIGE